MKKRKSIAKHVLKEADAKARRDAQEADWENFFCEGESGRSQQSREKPSNCNADLTAFKERWNFPGGASGKEPTCQCRRLKR